MTEQLKLVVILRDVVRRVFVFGGLYCSYTLLITLSNHSTVLDLPSFFPSDLFLYNLFSEGEINSLQFNVSALGRFHNKKNLHLKLIRK